MSKTVSNENGREAASDPESTGATQTWGKEVKSYVSTQHGVGEGMEVTQSRSSTLFLPQRAFSPVSVTFSQLWRGIQVPSRQLNIRVEHFREVNSWPFPVDPVKPGHTEEFLRMQETAHWLQGLTTSVTHYQSPSEMTTRHVSNSPPPLHGPPPQPAITLHIGGVPQGSRAGHRPWPSWRVTPSPAPAAPLGRPPSHSRHNQNGIGNVFRAYLKNKQTINDFD